MCSDEFNIVRFRKKLSNIIKNCVKDPLKKTEPTLKKPC